MPRIARFARPRLMAITDTTAVPIGELEARVERLARLCRPATVVVQLRDLELPVRSRLALAQRLREITRSAGQMLVVNDRLDLAVLAEADGVHLGEQSVSPVDARQIVGEGAWISRACHDPSQAQSLGADAVVLSPILAPRKGRPALGLGALTRARSADVMLFALGGVDAGGAAACLEAGADGVAAIGAALGASDPTPLLEALGVMVRVA
jgi:thiamine-phosphate pyrophosphorylase